MFKKTGWTPEPVEGNDWIKISSEEEKAAAYKTKLFDQADGVILLIPNKYSSVTAHQMLCPL